MPPHVTLYHIAIPLYLSYRILLANRLPISDCDEVYNYWEPLHYLLYQSGLQVWEYAHEYALRTYAYLMPLYGIARVYRVLIAERREWVLPALQLLAPHDEVVTEKLALFIMLRSTIALATGLAEIYWLSCLYTDTKLRGRVVLWTALLLLVNPGMTHSAGAFLPSSTWTAVSLVCFGLALQRKHLSFCMAAIVATLATGWPFGAAILVPIGVRVFMQLAQARGMLKALIFLVVTTTTIQAMVMMVDKQYYGVWTSPTFNIFQYNAGSGSDSLYGVEPISYYIKNILVNANLAGVFGAPAIVVSYFTQRRDWNVWLMLLSMWVWVAMTFSRPHKEERFLFPLYPLLCLGATLTLDAACNAAGRLIGAFSRRKELSGRTRMLCHAMVWIPAVMLSLARTAALTKYYTAPLHLYAALARQDIDATGSQDELLVCTCGEWYRFPSSFFLPDHVQLGFLPSSFKGQLPQPFSEFGSLSQSHMVLQPFNDRNLEETSRYVSLDKCEWIVDLQPGSDCIPQSSTIIARAPFLDASKTSTLHRVLHVPYWHEIAATQGQVHFFDYVLARRRMNDLPEQ
ncbi:hypothetical protein MPSEU_000738300 [Mayamaea pseudoterrestris]|nr:hypothetical protein MPSEU_000738300 [Mayamaea pseudoterrestris]